ncbi:MAG: ArnT family glycosyltransferase [Flexilinea sp.]
MDEITVLDYFKFKLNPKNWNREILPDRSETDLMAGNSAEAGKSQASALSFLEKIHDQILERIQLRGVFFCRMPAVPVLSAILLAVIAQCFLEPAIISGTRNPVPAVILYSASAVLLIIAFIFRKKEDDRDVPLIESPDHAVQTQRFDTSIRFEWLGASGISASVALLLFGGNHFTFINVTFWIASIIFGFAAFGTGISFTGIRTGFNRKLKKLNSLSVRFSPWMLIWMAAFGICVYFRFSQINSIPGDMFSDHAEKLYDVMDVLDGKTPIFFVRNTGREAFQFYWTVLMIKLFGTGVSFLSLKIGTVLAGLFALPYVYLLGKFVGNRWVGLFAMLFCGVAYWPNVISRVALRFAFYPMFTAPALYYFIKGLTNRCRKDLILSGIFLGIGLQGYSAMRIVPFVFILIFLIFWIFQPRGTRKNAAAGITFILFFTFLLCLPLLRVFLDMPDAVFYRVMTRLGETETTLSAPVFVVFLSNLWKAVVMPFWNNGGIWVHSIIFRPALDHFSASLFFFGMILIILRFIRRKRWQDLCLLLCIPLLMLPSILSIAFPDENPSLNRTGAAVIPIFIITAFGFCYILETILHGIRQKTFSLVLAVIGGGTILAGIFTGNYDLVFHTYRNNYDMNALNTRQIGSVIEGFAHSIGSYDDAFVIPYPYWVDTRLVGINAGVPEKDYALSRDMIASVGKSEDPMLFIYKEDDIETANTLESLYPEGEAILQENAYPGKNFYSYFVP